MSQFRSYIGFLVLHPGHMLVLETAAARGGDLECSLSWLPCTNMACRPCPCAQNRFSGHLAIEQRLKLPSLRTVLTRLRTDSPGASTSLSESWPLQDRR